MEIQEIDSSQLREFYRVFTQVLREDFPEYPPQLKSFFINVEFPREFLRKKISQWNYIVLLATEEGKVVGFLAMEKPYGGVSYCSWLGVLKAYRGQGVGSRLVEVWERKVIARGGHKLLLITQSEKNRQFYKNRGFDEEGFEKKSWFGLDAWLFGKIIGRPKPRLFLCQVSSKKIKKK
ncbi:MAG TPA: GNAT family N-acetyltransferase [Patescibacteria group bacterium]|nr:GNAT family N-acetyltransferase [Patescibacteria group bacterium]